MWQTMKHAGLYSFKKYNEEDEFFNISMPNDTYLILVKILPSPGPSAARIAKLERYKFLFENHDKVF